MSSSKAKRIAVLLSVPLIFLALTASSGGHGALPARAHSDQSSGYCVPVGGSISTNLGVIDANTTLGTATGDLRGALAANILGISQTGGNTVFTVQHHWVTESGDTLVIDKTNATSVPVASGLFAITNYSLHISNGTGKFSGASGDLHLIGEVDLNAGQTGFRYSGEVCFAAPGNE